MLNHEFQDYAHALKISLRYIMFYRKYALIIKIYINLKEFILLFDTNLLHALLNGVWYNDIKLSIFLKKFKLSCPMILFYLILSLLRLTNNY